jgi:hypothetical protein
VLDQRPGGGEPGRDGKHPGFGVDQLALGVGPVFQQQLHPLQRTAAVGDHAGGVGQRRKQLADDPQARPLATSPGDLAAHRLLEPGQAEASLPICSSATLSGGRMSSRRRLPTCSCS